MATTEVERAQKLGPATKATTKAELKRKRQIVALSPGGNTFTIRPLSLLTHALMGELPGQLRSIAMSAEGVNTLFKDDAKLTELGEEMSAHLHRLVAEVLVDPALTVEEIASGDYLLPVDFQWLVDIAFQEEDRDGLGRLLWGVEPLDRWALFRDRHECPEDCEGCDRVRRDVSQVVDRRAGAVSD